MTLPVYPDPSFPGATCFEGTRYPGTLVEAGSHRQGKRRSLRSVVPHSLA